VHVAGQEMGMGMALAVTLYQLGWFDAAMVFGGEGWGLLIHVVVCVVVVCMWFVRLVLYCTSTRESPFLPASKAV